MSVASTSPFFVGNSEYTVPQDSYANEREQ